MLLWFVLSYLHMSMSACYLSCVRRPLLSFVFLTLFFVHFGTLLLVRNITITYHISYLIIDRLHQHASLPWQNPHCLLSSSWRLVFILPFLLCSIIAQCSAVRTSVMQRRTKQSSEAKRRKIRAAPKCDSMHFGEDWHWHRIAVHGQTWAKSSQL